MLRYQRLIPAAAGLFLLPLLHPVLVPLAGVASHLAWFEHALPVALFTYFKGKRWSISALAASSVLVLVGERFVGGGFGVPAPWATTLALAIAVTITNGLVAAFAWYARDVNLRHRTLFNVATIGILRADAAGRIVEVNPMACDLLGKSSAELAGTSLDELLAQGPKARVDTTSGWSGVVNVPGGRARHLFVAVFPLHDPPRYLALLADRSMEVLQEREIERHARLAALGEALAGVAHELKNPLTVVIQEAELGAMSGGTEPEVLESFEVIKQQAVRMRHLIQELLGFSRPRDELDMKELHSLLETIAGLQRAVVSKSVTIETQLEASGCVSVSSSKIEQIFINLVSNAADALGDGGGVITMKSRNEGERVLLDVLDDGPGLPVEVSDKLFDPFFTTKPQGEGTGLGLAICRRLAESMEGTITAANRVPRGAQFTLTLPLCEPDEENLRIA
ncbi:MAG: nitrogen regulation protein NR(II) [Gemmatimonadales bacterium]